jgi:hypothetical protein
MQIVQMPDARCAQGADREGVCVDRQHHTRGRGGEAADPFHSRPFRQTQLIGFNVGQTLHADVVRQVSILCATVGVVGLTHVLLVLRIVARQVSCTATEQALCWEISNGRPCYKALESRNEADRRRE